MNIVDSCGWLEYFADGPNANFFAPIIENTKELLVPSICVLEVFRRAIQQKSLEDALQAATEMQQARVLNFDVSLALSAGKLGIQYKLPLADSIILATAYAYNAIIWTQDADFKNISGVHYHQKI
jgi:predicted nucleic acid-binding protein